MTDILAQYDHSLLPPELLLNEDHPDNDQYLKNTRLIQQQIVAQSARMRPKEIESVKMAHQGLNYVEIGQRLNISPQTASKYLKKEHGQRLKALLAHYDAAIEGPHRAQRKAMLWRIARRAETEDPRVAISAVAELNKVEEAQNQVISTGGTTQIVINTQQLPRGALDGEFETIE